MRARIVVAARELLRTGSYAELTVEEVMREAGQGRTIFYRHFDDLADLLVRASAEAVEQLYAAQVALSEARAGAGADAVRGALEPAAAVYHRSGPLLRAVAEAAAGDEQIAAEHNALRRRFDDLVAVSLRDTRDSSASPLADLAQTARALNLMNESYLLDVFGREPRVTLETAVQTLSEIWLAVVWA